MENAQAVLPSTELDHYTTSPIVQSSLARIWLKLRVLRQLFHILYAKTGNAVHTWQSLQAIRAKYRQVFGEQLLTKVARVSGRYFWRLGAPGFPSPASTRMHDNETNRLLPGDRPRGLRSLLLAITKKCPLNCEHCFEWDNLNKAEQLNSAAIIRIVQQYQDYGTTQMMFTGGEPMLRVNTIYQVLEAARPGTDFWIITSGLGLSRERAHRLREAGLTGVLVSLDHHERKAHNRFRGVPDAYEYAMNAIRHANEAGLVTALSLCATRDYVHEDQLRAYLELARRLGVSFVQFLEPRATGRYAGKPVQLTPEQIELLEQFYLTYNSAPDYRSYPIINYLGYHQRRAGCFGAGDRFFYIDTDGDAHICPFCSAKIGSALDHTPREMIEQLRRQSCHAF